MYQRTSYHSQQPNWRNGFRERGKYIGIEYEVESLSGNYQTLLNLIPDLPAELRPCCERDGSLDEYSGVEIIFPPIAYRSLKAKTGAFRQFLEAMDGNTHHHSSTGMHMNVNTADWGHAQRRLFAAVVHNMSSAQISRIGGRSPNSYCYQQPNRPLEDYSQSIGHGAVELKNGRLEMRFPKSTTDATRVELLVDFVDGLGEFCKKHAEDAESLITVKKLPCPTYYWSPAAWAEARESRSYSYSKLVKEFVSFMKTSDKLGYRLVAEVLTNGYDKKHIEKLKAGAGDDSTSDEAEHVSARPARAVA